jgi:hypothetical protein
MTAKEDNFKAKNKVFCYREQASELVASRFLKHCYTCGHPVVIKRDVTTEDRKFKRYEFMEPQKLHTCKETKTERLADLNRKARDI